MRRVAATAAAIGLILGANAALGQTPPPVSPIASIEVSPRMWYLFESFGPATHKPAPGTVFQLNGDEYALGGASVSARFTELPETSFILSGLYGTNDPSPATGSLSVFPGFLANLTGKVARTDVELLAQTAIPETSAAWLLGGRFEHHDLTTVTRIFPSNIPLKGSSTGNIYSAKAGVTGAVPLTPDHNLRLFGNAQILAGVDVETPTVGIVGPDLAIGLQYAFSPTINADLRYRAVVYFTFDVPRGALTPQYVVYQGPMIGLNIKF